MTIQWQKISFQFLRRNVYIGIFPTTFDEARKLIDNYIYFYNNKRIQLKTGVAPPTQRDFIQIYFPILYCLLYLV